MFMLSPPQIQELKHFAYISDKEIRSDLCRHYIKTENDYTSNFTGALRRNINSYTTTGLQATSYLLAPNQERQMGCDAAIIICSNSYTKIAVFEAKWPRVATPYYQWDHAQTSSGLSHFSDQLERQKWYCGNLAIFEMFYCEYPPFSQPDYMQDEVSSCVWHTNAMAFKNRRNNPDALWSQAELVSMLTEGTLNVGEILEAVCQCHVGQPIPMSNPEDIAQEFSLPSNILFIQAGENVLNLEEGN